MRTIRNARIVTSTPNLTNPIALALSNNAVRTLKEQWLMGIEALLSAEITCGSDRIPILLHDGLISLSQEPSYAEYRINEKLRSLAEQTLFQKDSSTNCRFFLG